LLPMPKGDITLQEKQEAIKLLSHSGASITELNQVRIALSGLKGGQLAHLAKKAKVVCLVLSDIIGDPMHLIASGPTVQPPLESPRAMEIIEKYNLQSKMPAQVITCLKEDQNVPLLNTENVIYSKYLLTND
jgi:glycerate 2-kinase